MNQHPDQQNDVLTFGLDQNELEYLQLYQNLFRRFSEIIDSCIIMNKSIDSPVQFKISTDELGIQLDTLLSELLPDKQRKPASDKKSVARVDKLPLSTTLNFLFRQGAIQENESESIKAFLQRRKAAKEYIQTSQKSPQVKEAELQLSREKDLDRQPGRDVYVFFDNAEYGEIKDKNTNNINPVNWFYNLFLTSTNGGRHIIDSLNIEKNGSKPCGNPLGAERCPQHNMMIAPKQKFFRQGRYGPWPTAENQESTATVVLTYAYEFENFTPQQILAEECPFITKTQDGLIELGQGDNNIVIFQKDEKSIFLVGKNLPETVKLYFNPGLYKQFIKDKLLRELKSLVEAHKKAGVTGPIQANMTLPGLGYFANMGGDPACNIRNTLSPFAIEAYQEALQELDTWQKNHKDKTYIAAVRVSFPETIQENIISDFNNKFVESNKQGIVVKATINPVDNLTELLCDLELEQAVFVAGDPRAQPGNEKAIESAEPGIFANFAFAREIFNPLLNAIKLRWFNLSKSHAYKEYQLEEFTQVSPPKEEMEAHEKNMELMTSLLQEPKVTHDSSSSFIERFEEISYQNEQKKLIQGVPAIQTILESRKDANPNYMLVRQKTFPGRKNEWYLYHIGYDKKLVIRNVDHDPSLKDLSSILKGKNFDNIKFAEKIEAFSTIDDYFTKKTLLKERETSESIIKIQSSPSDHNNNVKAQAEYLWKKYIQPKIENGEFMLHSYTQLIKNKLKSYMTVTLISIFP